MKNPHVLFPDAVMKPSRLAIELQKRIRFMFGIDVVPEIIRRPESYYSGEALAYKWTMRTVDGKYEIASYELAEDMATREKWRVLEGLLKYLDTPFTIGKTIY